VHAHWRHGCGSTTKQDGSPVTVADQEAEALILAGLRTLAPGAVIIAEEEAAAGLADGPCPETFFLVDPLDGTRDFVEAKDRGEFTVNIALVEKGRPVLGAVYAPARGRLYAGGPAGAWTAPCDPETAEPLGPPAAIHVAASGSPLRAVRSRRSNGADAFLDRVGPVARTGMSSSLKFCIVAAGEADLYPRFEPVSEWDVAAGEAVLAAAGGVVVDLQGKPLRYGDWRRSFRVDGFVALGGPAAQAAGRAALKAR
jgi:3'(2'),5'-bisphosphate nucleotidase